MYEIIHHESVFGNCKRYGGTSISDVPVDSVCAVEIWAKYPEDWTCGCDAYLASRKTLGTMALVLIAIPVVMIMACLPFIMAGGM